MIALAKKLQEITKTEWSSAGEWYYNENMVKTPKRADPDGTPPHEKTNILKTQLDNKLIVIDADGANLDELAKIFPSINNTFTTQTTNLNKRHFYFQPNKKIGKTRTTNLDAQGPYDIITSGIMFEGHNIPNQPAEWKVVNNVEVATLTEDEIEKIKLITKSSPRAAQQHAYYISKAMPTLIEQALAEDNLTKLSKPDWNKLVRCIMNSAYNEETKLIRKRLTLPNLSYTTINNIACKLAYNAVLPTDQALKFLNKLLKDYYLVNPDSQETHQRLHKQILPSLPTHDNMIEAMVEADEFTDLLTPTAENGWGLVKYIDNRELHFMELNLTTLKPRHSGRNSAPAMNASTISQLRGYSKEDFQMIPLVKVVNDPFSGPIGLDLEAEMDTVNLSLNSEYYDKAVPLSTQPTNAITRLITSYFGTDQEELYYHWLANAMYNSRAPQTVPVLVSPKEDAGATGKSSLAQALPTRLIYATGTIDPESTEKGWGDVVDGKRLLCLNDVKPMKSRDKLASLQAFIRDRTTGGARRHDNMKGMAFKTSSSTVAFSFSANWVPSIDEHDRRFWYVLPASIYAHSQPLSTEDSSLINQWFEHTPLDSHIDAVQEIANYLLYIYKEHYTGSTYHKNFVLLYNTAPHTMGREMALKQKKTYSEQLLPAIRKGPQALEDLLGSDIDDVVRFVAMQYYKEYISLPWDFIATIQARLHHDGEVKTTKTSLAAAIQVEPEKFTNTGKNFLSFKNPIMLATYELDESYGDFTQQQLKIPMTEIVYKLYIKRIEHMVSTPHITGEDL